MLPPRLTFLLSTTAPSPATMMMMIVRIPNSLSSLSLLRFSSIPSFSKSLHARSYTLPSAAVAETSLDISTATTPTVHHHPWPEWVDFIDRLKSKGYFPQSSNPNPTEFMVYREMNDLKDPCLSFARDRYDIFGSLSKGDIKAIVEGGCPKILRKVVNSAKRLRVYVGLDESNVCSACSLQGSCDRAYVTLKESEQDARTVDLVRLLLFYALDPLVISGDAESQSVDQVNSSAKRLLRMLTNLSEAPVIPAPVQPSTKESFQKKQIIPSEGAVVPQSIEMKEGDWTCPECSFMNFSRNIRCRKCSTQHPEGESGHYVERKRGSVEMKRGNVETKGGDWNCPECNYMNFWRNVQCRKCKAKHPKSENAQHVEMKRGDVEMKAGDWNCPKCSFMNFSRNVRCRECDANRPKGENAQHVEIKRGNVEMKAGDWNCPKCKCMNFASRIDCFSCKESRPPRNLNPGEWECLKCDYLNFRRNINCLKCGTGRVKEAVSQYEEQFWRRPQ